jgi:hypothetical protein
MFWIAAGMAAFPFTRPAANWPHELSHRRGIESNRFTPNDQETYNVEYSEMCP